MEPVFCRFDTRPTHPPLPASDGTCPSLWTSIWGGKRLPQKGRLKNLVYELVYRLGRQFAHKSPKAARVRCRNLQARSQLSCHGHHAVTQIAPITLVTTVFGAQSWLICQKFLALLPSLSG